MPAPQQAGDALQRLELGDSVGGGVRAVEVGGVGVNAQVFEAAGLLEPQFKEFVAVCHTSAFFRPAPTPRQAGQHFNAAASPVLLTCYREEVGGRAATQSPRRYR